jgi:hypothetical protein
MVRALTPASLAAGALVTLALLSAACGDPASRITSPAASLSSSLSASKSPPPPQATGFTLLGNAAVTCTNGTVTGNVGTFLATPTGAITQTGCPITGSINVGTAASVQAYNAFLAEYAALAPKPGDVCTTETGTLAGVILAPGNYCFDAAATLTGVLTLNGPANGVWTFNFSVVMAGGGNACNVTWWVSQAATMTTSAFQGSILAGAAITLTGGTFNGDAWSQAGVTVTGTAVTGCASSAGGGGGGEKGKDHDKDHDKDHRKGKCNQGVGNGPEGCDPGNSDHRHGSNDEDGGTRGHPGRRH